MGKAAKRVRAHSVIQPVSAEKFAALPSFFRAPQKLCKYGKVAVDNTHGMGVVPNTAEFDYFGFAVEFNTKDFRWLALSGDRQGTANDLVPLLLEGTPTACPFLNVEIISGLEDSGDVILQVKGHEGRARTMALETVNSTNWFSVIMFPLGLRARNLDVSFFDRLRNTGRVYKEGYNGDYVSSVSSLRFGECAKKIWWQGRTL